jgi:hypothetical protein
MHANDVFSFFKNHFWHQHIKTIQNVQIILNFSKKKIKIFWKHSRSRVPKRSCSRLAWIGSSSSMKLWLLLWLCFEKNCFIKTIFN